MTRHSRLRVLVSLAAMAATVFGASTAATAAPDVEHAVFVQTNDKNANSVVVYERRTDGTLSRVQTVKTGGRGGILGGAEIDPLSSQGAVTYDAAHHLLFVVNAGSNTIAVLRVSHNRAQLRQVLPSGGKFPVSVTVHGNLAYVVNALGAGSISGFSISDSGAVQPLSGSTRSLKLTPVTGKEQFVNTPGQIAFSVSGHYLVVPTKANRDKIDVFVMQADGRPSTTFVENDSVGDVPFAVTFDNQKRLVVAAAGGSKVSTYRIEATGHLVPVSTLATNKIALCWIASSHDFAFGANTGSDSVSTYRIDSAGKPTVVADLKVPNGPIDLVASPDGHYLYVQVGSGDVAEFRVNTDGSLTKIGKVGGLVGAEGITVS